MVSETCGNLAMLYSVVHVVILHASIYIYSGTWELGTPKGLRKTVLNSKVVLFLRSISVYRMGLATGVAVLSSLPRLSLFLRWSQRRVWLYIYPCKSLHIVLLDTIWELSAYCWSLAVIVSVIAYFCSIFLQYVDMKILPLTVQFVRRAIEGIGTEILTDL